MEAAQRLRDPYQWIPDDLMPFDIRRLRDAELILLDGTDPTALVRRIVEFHRSGERVRGLARGAAPTFIENQWELTVHGDTRVELVVTPEAVDVVRNHQPTAQKFREMLNTTNARYSVYEEIPISVGIVNGTVGINLTDEQGVLKGGMVTDDEAVHAWAVDLFETCQEQARPVNPDAITV
jgi:predicted transcriptional regulator